MVIFSMATEDISATIYEHVCSEEKLVIKIEMTEAVYEIARSPYRGPYTVHTYQNDIIRYIYYYILRILFRVVFYFLFSLII